MRKKIIFTICALVFVLIVWTMVDFMTAVTPDKISFVDLSQVAAKEMLTEEDYALIFRQTGLGKPAVDSLKATSKKFLEDLQQFQEQKLTPVTYDQTFLFFPTTTAELLTNEDDRFRDLLFPPLETGDIFITGSTKTLLYRHGHTGLLIDAQEGKVAEALMLGAPSAITSTDAWSSYATLLILRPKADAETISKAVDFTKENLVNIPYNLLTGVLQKDKSHMAQIDSTHCSHLVWQAYKVAGLDLDSDGGWQVTPKDLSGSSALEIVFSYNFGEDGRW